MKKGSVVVIALALMLLMSASMIAAQEKAAPAKEQASCHKEMKLTDENKGKVEELKMNFHLKTIDLKAEQQKLGIMLKKEMMKPEPVMQDVEGIVRKMSAVREKLQLARIEHMLAMRKVLGPDWRKHMHAGMGGCGEMMGEAGMEFAGDEKDVVIMRQLTPGMGAMKGGSMMMQKGGKCCSQMSGKWHGKMFRPFGKKSCCPGMSGGMMHKGARGAGGCMGEKTGKESCSMSCTEEGARKEIKCKVEIKERKKR